MRSIVQDFEIGSTPFVDNMEEIMSNRDVKYRERREDSVPKQVSIRLD